jgi:hypothetical protein
MTDIHAEDPVLSARAAASRELRALDALLASSDGGGPPVCSSLLRAWYEVASLAWALGRDEKLGYRDFIDGVERGDPLGGPVGELVAADHLVRVVISAGAFPPPSDGEWPARRALLRYRRALVRWWTHLEKQVRARARPNRRRLVATAVALATLALAALLLHRPPVWRVVYFRTTHLAEPVASDLTASLGGNWGAGSPHRDVPDDGFSARWETCLVLDRPRTFEFVLGSDDGSRLIVDDQTVVDQWNNQSYTEKKGTVALGAGSHRVRVEHFDSSGNADLSLAARIDGKGEARPLPTSLLRAPGQGDAPCGH